jgi:hypothetical protein
MIKRDVIDERPNGLHQPQAGTSTGSAERERRVAAVSVEDRPDPACRAACGVGRLCYGVPIYRK